MSEGDTDQRWTLSCRCPKCGKTYSGGDVCRYCEVELVENPRTKSAEPDRSGGGVQ